VRTEIQYNDERNRMRVAKGRDLEKKNANERNRARIERKVKWRKEQNEIQEVVTEGPEDVQKNSQARTVVSSLSLPL
jgi:hypothetical protein